LGLSLPAHTPRLNHIWKPISQPSAIGKHASRKSYRESRNLHPSARVLKTRAPPPFSEQPSFSISNTKRVLQRSRQRTATPSPPRNPSRPRHHHRSRQPHPRRAHTQCRHHHHHQHLHRRPVTATMPVTTQPNRASCGGARGAKAPCNQSRKPREWQKGDIAFLKTKEMLSAAEVAALLKPNDGYVFSHSVSLTHTTPLSLSHSLTHSPSHPHPYSLSPCLTLGHPLTCRRERYGYMNERALGHPVIILDRISPESDHVLITSVSAYSVERNGGLPPWEQFCHRKKNPESFRSFNGCERYNTSVPPLYLVDGQMPKPEASWVYCESLYVVPLSVIGVFTKSKTQLRMRPDSLEELMTFMSQRMATKNKLEAAQKRLRLKEPRATSGASTGPGISDPAQKQNWRVADSAGSPSNPPSPSPRVLPPKRDSTSTAPAAATTTTAAVLPSGCAISAAAPAKKSWASIAQAKPAPVNGAQKRTTATAGTW
jgi:hypothetical protein